MLHKQIREEMLEALKAKDSVRLTTLRGLVTAFTNELVDKKRKPDEELSDEDTLAVISRAAKQRKDSIEQFTKGGRDDLAKIETEELAVIETYLPKMMPTNEVEKIVKKKKDELGITDKSDMGKLMGAIMQELKGKADGTDVKEAVNKLFA